MSAARTERLLNLLTLLLNSRRPIALREIRELDEFGAYRTEDPKSGERAFERDKAALLELGVPLRWVAPEHEDDDEGLGGYIVDKSRYFLPELHLSPGELALLSIAGAAAAALGGFSGRAAVIRALAKLGFDEVPSSGRLPALAHAPLLAGADAERVGAHLTVLHDAIAYRRCVVLHYANAGEGAAEPRTVSSYGLYYRQGIWYLVGHCHLRKAVRTFNVARITRLKAVGAVAAFVVPATFNLKALVQRRPWEFGEGAATTVVIRLASRLRPAVAEIFGPHVHQSAPADDGSVLVQLQATQPEALLATVLPHGDAAEVLAPTALRGRMAAIYGELAHRYADAGDLLAAVPRVSAAS